MPKLKKKKMLMLFGGESEEHAISLLSAKNILKAVNKDKYEVTLVGITKNGLWKKIRSAQLLDNSYIEVTEDDSKTEVSFSFTKKRFCFHRESDTQWINFDVAFPVLHGRNGEDGTVQGFFEIAGIPYVGGSVLGSAIGMDKDIAKRILLQAGLPVARHITVQDFSERPTYKEVSKKLGTLVYVKPARSGSSIGVSRVENEDQYTKALKVAFKEDSKILIEGGILGRELECAVLGNSKPETSAIGEVVLSDTFYDYNEKYSSTSLAEIVIPAKLTSSEIATAQELAKKTYLALCCRGLARVDLFLSKGEFYVNEINTMPGFTNRSMYPKLWENTGLTYNKLIERLLNLATKKN